MNTVTSTQSIPTYMSFLTLTTFLDWIKEMAVIPEQIDRSLWESKFSGSVGSQLIPNLRFLQLLDGNRPSSDLQHLAHAADDDRKLLLVNCLRKAYGDELVDGLRTGTPKTLDDKLRALGATDGTIRKAASFLINAAKYADIEMQPVIRKRARNKPSRARAPRPKPIAPSEPARDSQTGSSADNFPPESPPRYGLRPVVAALIGDLEDIGEKWNKSERETWLKTFQVTLEYAYPAKLPDDQNTDEAE